VGDSGDTSYGDIAAFTWDEYPSLADGEVMDQLRMALAVREPVPGFEPVLPLFDALARQFAEGKIVSAAAVRGQFGLNKNQAEAWFGQLQDALRAVTEVTQAAVPAAEPEELAEPGFTEAYETTGGGFWLAGLTLTVQEVRDAAAALKASRGNRVLPAFKDSGSRLAEAGKAWYLDFAEEVMQAFPELRTATGGHYEGGHFGRVKNALIAGLDLLAPPAPEAPVAEPDVEPVPEAAVALDAALWANLEAALGQFPGFAGETLDAALEAVRLLVPA